MRQKQNQQNRGDEHDLIEEGVAQPDGESNPRVGRKEAYLRCEVVGVPAKPAQGVRPEGTLRWRSGERLELFLDSVPVLAIDPGSKELVDVSASRNGGEIVE